MFGLAMFDDFQILAVFRGIQDYCRIGFLASANITAPILLLNDYDLDLEF
jgi:hypothetical protein